MQRTLWYEAVDGRQEVAQSELLDLTVSVVVLGEAGMGKSFMLEQLRDGGAAFCTARQLTNRFDPRSLLGGAGVLLVDALDEVAARADGDAVDLVLRKLGELGCPRFILSCRAAEWRQASAKEAIIEQYAGEPLVLHLAPFTRTQTVAFLAREIGDDLAQRVVRHFEDRGFHDFLGNPQTLELIMRVAHDLPESRSGLFEAAVEVLWQETNDKKAPAALDRASTLDAAGAAFAGLILTGSGAIARSSLAALEDGVLPLAEVEAFDSGNVGATLTTRLYGSIGPDRFSYWHRRLGEYLGACWLAAQANTDVKRQRLLTLFHAHGLVPASLRGLHAWLARDPRLAPAVIAADPMGVIEYGDADVLDEGQARVMLAALRKLAIDNPRFFDWGSHRARSLVQPALLGEVRALIRAPDTVFGLRMLLLEQVRDTPSAREMAVDLTALLLDPHSNVAARESAGAALVTLGDSDWPMLIETLRCEATHDATRLASDLLGEIGFSIFSDAQIVDVTFAHAGLTLCTVPKESADRMVGKFRKLEKELPDDRLDGVLDEFAYYADALLERGAGYEVNELIDLAHALILRRIRLGAIDPVRLWRWLRPYEEQDGYRRDHRETLADWLRGADDVRRAIQRHVLLLVPGDKSVRERSFRLSDRSNGLTPTPDDVVAMFAELDSDDRGDERWRDVVQLARHDLTVGTTVRTAARPFARHEPETLAWLDGLAEPYVPDWQVKQEERRNEQAAKRAAEWAEHRSHFEANIEKLRAGEYWQVLRPAKAYLKQYHHVGGDLPAHERIGHWVGAEVAEAAHAGFEAFLTATPAKPTAVELAKSHADGRGWEAGCIIVAALGERMRSGRGFGDLRAERLMAGWYELRHRVDQNAGLDGLRDAVEAELRRRDKWRSTLLLHFRPQFDNARAQVDGLYPLMRSEPDAALAADFAIRWLDRYPDMPSEAEIELVDRLLGSDRSDDLRRIAVARRGQARLDAERRRTWDAVEIIVDFEAACTRRAGFAVESELLWHLRARAGGRRRHDHPRLPLAIDQMRWIVETFRAAWPYVPHPTGTMTGDSNSWDAAEFLASLLGRIADDASDAGLAALAMLRDAPADGYTEICRYVAAEQRQKRVEQDFTSPTLDAINAILTNGPLTDCADLQAAMLQALDEAQRRLKGDRLDWYKGYFDDAGKHRNEEACRDELLKLLDGKVAGVELRPESHLADDKRVDIECSVGPSVMLPIEVKGQWHPKLWTAADDQLDVLYSADWRAERRGIYLVLWFGPSTRVTRPPDGVAAPRTPCELQFALVAHSKAARAGRVQIVVLDLQRPLPASDI